MHVEQFPQWLTWLAAISLLVGFLCALLIVIDIARGHRQHMWIMEVVWPITALYSGPVALLAYFRVGRLSTQRKAELAKERDQTMPGKTKPFWQSVGVGATHCGGGCTLGDIIAEWAIVIAPFTLFGKSIFAAWLLDFILAFLFGIAFQYYTIKPMRGLSVGDGIMAAVKADTLSLSAWQIGMYGWMAVATFGIFGAELSKTSPVFWFMMQIAMFFGFATAYPVNWWLLRRGIKEAM